MLYNIIMCSVNLLLFKTVILLYLKLISSRKGSISQHCFRSEPGLGFFQNMNKMGLFITGRVEAKRSDSVVLLGMQKRFLYFSPIEELAINVDFK